MPATVLVPIDRSSQSIAGLVYALESFPEATITALHVVDVEHDAHSSVGADEPPLDSRRRGGERILERATDRVASDREIRTALETGVPHRTIVQYAVDHDVDHIVLGSHGESPIVRPFLGHVSEAVIRRAPVSTTIVPESRAALEERTLPGRIMVPVDDSAPARAALSYATRQFPSAEITLFHCVSLPFEYDLDGIEGTYVADIVDTLTERGAAVLESSVRAFEGDASAIDSTELAHGKPSRVIVDHAVDTDHDQIIMGSHGRSLPSRVLTGSVAETVSRRSTIPVTLVREDHSMGSS